MLGVDPMDLIEVPRKRERTESGAVNGVRDVVRVLRRDPWRLTGGEPDLGRMATRLDDAESLRRQCRYAELGQGQWGTPAEPRQLPLDVGDTTLHPGRKTRWMCEIVH